MKQHIAVVGASFAGLAAAYELNKLGLSVTVPTGRLFFAGEHTAEQSATMEGALASGLRASKQVMEKINEQ